MSSQQNPSDELVLEKRHVLTIKNSGPCYKKSATVYYVVKDTEIRHGMSEVTKIRVERTSSPYRAIRIVTITKGMWSQGKPDGYFYRMTWRTVSGEMEKFISIEKLEDDGKEFRVVETKPPRGRVHPSSGVFDFGGFSGFGWALYELEERDEFDKKKTLREQEKTLGCSQGE